MLKFRYLVGFNEIQTKQAVVWIFLQRSISSLNEASGRVEDLLMALGMAGSDWNAGQT